MSYSFNVVAATKEEAKERVAAEFQQVVEYPPTHAKDREQALAAANALIDLLEDDSTKNLSASVSGWLSWNFTGPDDDPLITGVTFSVSVSLVDRPAPEA